MKHILLTLALMTLVMAAWADWEIEESFENSSTPAGWSVVDEDGDGLQWGPYENAGYANTGSYMMSCVNYLPNQNEDWLITPQFVVETGDSLHFYARSWYGTENLEVLLSTDTASLNDFDYTLAEFDDIDDDYQLVSLSLEDYIGESVYIAFYWECDTYCLLIDDVAIGSEPVVEPTMDLPDSYTFFENETLVVDMAPYIQNATPATATLTANDGLYVDVSITGFEVTFTDLGSGAGTDQIDFWLTWDTGAISDPVNVTVLPEPVVELQAQDVLAPLGTIYQDMPVQPAFSFYNYGTVTLTESFNISCVIIDDNGLIVHTPTENYSDDVAAGEVVEYVFSSPFTPDAEGDYVISFTVEYTDSYLDDNTIESGFSVVEHFGEGGPDDFGYYWIDSEMTSGPAYDWIDISATGASAIMEGVSSFAGDDNMSEPIDFGFTFPFYGVDYETFHVDTNGEILLAENTWYTPYPEEGWNNDGNVFNWSYDIPGYTQMPALVSVFWDDLEADEGVGDIYYQTFGTAPDRYCVVQWHDFRFHAGDNPQALLNFEAIFYESGEILMQYHTTATGQTGSLAPHDNAQSGTVAIQNAAADIGLCYLQEQVEGSVWVGVEPVGNILHDGLAIRFEMGEDTQPPVVTHEAPGNTFDNSFTLKATAIDASDIMSMKLYYQCGGSWTEMDYTTIGEDGEFLYDLSDIPLGEAFDYYYEATDANGYSATLPAGAPDDTFSFRLLPSEGVEILLAYSGQQDYQETELPNYEEILQQLNVDYDLYNWEEYPSYRIPNEYRTIFAFASTGSAGDDSDTLSVALMEFLDAGEESEPHNLFFASDNFAYTQGGQPNDEPTKMLLNAYFRTDYIGTSLGGGTNGLAGPDYLLYESGSIVCIDDSPIGDEGDELEVYANSPDCLFENDECPSWYADIVQNPDIGSHNAYVFEDGPVDGQAYLYHGVCATWIDNLIYRAFYFSFDLSQVTASDDRQMMIADALEWFQSVESSDTELVSAQFVLERNTPNPFNPSTTIRFSLPQDAQVKLAVYNVRGQLVTTLVDGELTSGAHQAVWNGLSRHGESAASGVYFYRLEMGEKMLTNKMLLLK